MPLVRYEREVLAANETNDRYFVTLGALERQRQPDETVVLDPTLQKDRTGAAGTAQRTFDFMLELHGIQRVFLEDSSERIGRQHRRLRRRWCWLTSSRAASATGTTPTPGRWSRSTNDEGGGFTLWRITRR